MIHQKDTDYSFIYSSEIHSMIKKRGKYDDLVKRVPEFT